MANNFQNGPGGRLIKAQADNDSMPGIMLPEVEVTAPANSKNVDFGYMRPTISPLNQQQFMNVATGKDPGFQGQATMEQLREKMRGYKPEQIKASGRVGGYNPVNPIVFGQNPRSAAAMLGKVLTLGGEPMPGQGYSFSPTETLKGAAFDFATGEAIGAGVKAAAPYVKPAMNKAIQYITTKTPLRDAYKLNPFAFKPNQEMMYRGITKKGYDDAIESGLFRSPSHKAINKTGTTYWTDANNFKRAEKSGYIVDPSETYIAEYPKNKGNFDIRYSRFDENSPLFADFYKSDIPLDIAEGNVLKKHWLKGYSPVKFK